MKRFNPEKELYKIQHGNRNKVLYGIILLLLIISIGSTYALYQVRYTKRIIYTKVAPFSTHDIDLAVYLDGALQTKVPAKGTAYYDNVTCDNDSKAYASWDYENWRLKELNVSVPNKCNINFTKNYRDASGANAPKLYQGLIPVYFNDGNIYIADVEKEWYDYDKQNWANAVLIDYANKKDIFYKDDGTLRGNTQIQEEDILQMYVWIPRFKYELFNPSNGTIKEQMINIKFEYETGTTGEVKCTIASNGKETCTGAKKGAWYTHPAFTFGKTELKGIWVGKFETGGTLTNINILPDMDSIRSQTVSNMFNASRYIEETYATRYNLDSSQIDTHMMKNMEWGAMAYLTHSKYGICDSDGTCVNITRNTKYYKTGYDNTGSLWNTTNGQRASTTGNMYGIYDTNGEEFEAVMANMVTSSGEFNPSNAGTSFYIDKKITSSSKPDEKYYDKYEYGTNRTDHTRGHLGDATIETTRSSNTYYDAWYGSASFFIWGDQCWFSRDAGPVNWADSTAVPGIFAYIGTTGASERSDTFRIALTTQDGNS